MSEYDRTAIQAIIGQKLDGQFQKLLSDYERPIQQKHFALRQLCTKAEKLNPDLVGMDQSPVPQAEDLEYVFAHAEQDIADKTNLHTFTRKSLQAAQLRHGYACTYEGHSILQSVLLLLIAVCGETLINASFFSNAHMVTGPTAALISSFLISMTNASICACAGYFIGRYLNYGSNALDGDDGHFRYIRALARILLIAYIALMGFFHITVGLIRSQESLENIRHSMLAYVDMIQTPEAVFLILIGTCMSIIAFHKGMHSFDCPYPELGRLQRAEIAAKQQIQSAFDSYQEEISDYFEDAEKAINSPVEGQKKAIEKYNKSVSECHEARRRLEHCVRGSETQCRGKLAELITTYSAISGKEQSIPADELNRMVCFNKYLDVEIPAFHATPGMNGYKSDLLLEKNKAVNRLSSIFGRFIGASGDMS